MTGIADLQERRKLLWQHLKSSRTLLVRSKYLYEALEKRYKDDKKAYETIDHELALLDGRMEKFAYIEKAKVRVKERPFTKDQLIEIAEKLGIDLGLVNIE